jgi:hypothetical protein
LPAGKTWPKEWEVRVVHRDIKRPSRRSSKGEQQTKKRKVEARAADRDGSAV